MRDADAAMYRAKERGRGRSELFDEEMSTRAIKRLETETRLRTAIDDGEFRLLYQPEVDIATGAMVAVEALVRWEHPERGLLAPAEFIQVAEDTALIVPLGEWVMREACRQMKEWRETHQLNGSAPRMFLNMSGRQLSRPDFVSTISRVVGESGVRGDDLGVEIAESVLMEDIDSTLSTLKRLKELGLALPTPWALPKGVKVTGPSSTSWARGFWFRVMFQSVLTDLSSGRSERSVARFRKRRPRSARAVPCSHFGEPGTDAGQP